MPDFRSSGLQELSFEPIVARYPGEFSAAAVEAAHARLEGRQPPANGNVASRARNHDESGAAKTNRLSPTADAEADAFVSGFLQRDAWYNRNWASRYAASLTAIATALVADRPEDAFDPIWRTADNSISSAGQGLLRFGETRDPALWGQGRHSNVQELSV